MSCPTLTVIIPGFNRVEPLKYTLRSVAAAARVFREPVEILLVDDGSGPPLSEQLAGFATGHTITHLHQINAGSIVARRHGLDRAAGDYVLFLDSDDLVHPEKFQRQIAAMRATSADVSYSDMARASLGPDHSAAYTPAEQLADSSAPADFYLRVQPVPHGPIYRRNYLLHALSTLIVPALRAMDPVGDVWLYYNLAPHPARIVKVSAPLTAIGPHEEDRYSRHWEKLGLAALQVAEAFVVNCLATPATLAARIQVGESAFNSWRRLPRRFHADYERRALDIWRRSPRGPLARLGGPLFQSLARVFGAAVAGHILRLRNPVYAHVHSLDEDAYRRLFSSET